MVRRTRLIVPMAAGLGVGLCVARVFVDFAPPAMLLGVLAFGFTMAGAARAIGADRTGQAALRVFLWSLLPPACLFAVTVYGLFFAVPAGIAAAVITLPLVLIARAWSELDDERLLPRELLLSAVFLLAVAVGLASIIEDRERAEAMLLGPEHRSREISLPLLAFFSAFLAFVSVFARDVAASRLVARLRRAPDTLVTRVSAGEWEISELVAIGDGPMRTQVTEHPVARVQASALRGGVAVLGALCSLGLAVALIEHTFG